MKKCNWNNWKLRLEILSKRTPTEKEWDSIEKEMARNFGTSECMPESDATYIMRKLNQDTVMADEIKIWEKNRK